MKVEMMAIDAIFPYPGNPRENDSAVEAVAASIRSFGFRQPIVTDEAMVVIVGHTRLKAARLLGLAEVPVHIAIGLTPEQARAYRIADNKTSELATWDDALLGAELAALAGGDVDMAAFGFEEGEIDALIAGMTAGEGESTGGAGSLSDRFIVPPFSVLDARQGYWQDRKREWLALGIKSEIGRGGGLGVRGDCESGSDAEHSAEAHDKSRERERESLPRGFRDAARSGKEPAAPGGSARPACDYSKRQRGDGKGRPIA